MIYYDRNGNLKLKDMMRMKFIMDYLKCKFFRYNEKTKELKEYFNDADLKVK